MTAFVPAPGVVQLGVICLLDNQPVENTFHYHVTGTIDRAKLQAICTTADTWFHTNRDDFGTNWQVVKYYARDLSTQFGLSVEQVPAVPITGSDASGTLPNNVTIAVKRQTGLAGRANRGRIYWMGITRGLLADDNHVLPAVLTDWSTELNTLMTAQVTDNAAQEVILHKKLGTYTPVLNYTYSDTTLDSQRRRLPDHNRHN